MCRVSKKKSSLGFETIMSVLVSCKYFMGHNSILSVGNIFQVDLAMGQVLVMTINNKPKISSKIHLSEYGTVYFLTTTFFGDTL